MLDPLYLDHSLFSVTGNTLDIEFLESYVPDPSYPDSDPEIPSDDEIEDDDEDD